MYHLKLEWERQWMNEQQDGRDCRVCGISECVAVVTYTSWRVLFVWLSHFQHSATPFFLCCTGTYGSLCTQSLATATLFTYGAETLEQSHRYKIKPRFKNILLLTEHLCDETSTDIRCRYICKDNISVDVWQKWGVSWMILNAWPLKTVLFSECS
jgi:hypothetical protein